VHLLLFKGNPNKIVPEGEQYLDELEDISQLKEMFKKDDKYLFFSINDKMWTVNLKLGKPRFFRDRFAKVLGVSKRGDWKEMHNDSKNYGSGIKGYRKLKN
jgi:hypothetical protein